jgi:hypothetical protein
MIGIARKFTTAVAAMAILGAVSATQASAATPRLWVAHGPALYEFDANATGNVAPIAVITGAATGLGNPTSLAIDPAGNIWVADLMGGAKILEFRAGSNGNVSPIATLAGAKTHITETYGIWIDPIGHLFLGNVGTAPDPDRELEFAPGARGNVAPIANIVGPSTGIDAPGDVTTNGAANTWIADFDGNELQEFASGATGNVAPLATIKGAGTGLATPFGIATDPAGRIVTANDLDNTIAVFGVGAHGNAAPLETIAGTNTLLQSPTQIKIDVGGTMFVANGDPNNPILEFAAGTGGNAAPAAEIAGPATGLSSIRAIALVPPSVTTGQAGGAGKKAQLNATVNPQASDTHYRFDWGPTTSYGKTTPLTDVGAGTSPVGVNASISGLTPGQTYHYRVFAWGLGGFRYGADQSFTVPATATVPGVWIANQGASTVTEYAPGAFGDAVPILKIAGADTNIAGPFGVALDAGGQVYVTSNSTNSVEEFGVGVHGNVAPTAEISGPDTQLAGPNGIAIGASGRIFVANSTSTITAYGRGANGDAQPIVISGSNTQLAGPQGLAVSDRLYVANSGGNSILEFAASATGNVSPLATIAGPDTGISSPESVAVNAAGYITVGNASGSLEEFAPGATGDATPIAAISGAATGLNGPFGAGIDANRRLFAANFGPSSVTEYDPDATGNVAPSISLSGPQTGLKFPGSLTLATPFAVTSAASGVGSSSATLNGTVNPQGIGTHYHFQYGTSTAYGHTTPNATAGGGIAAVAVSAAATGLAPSTLYHYRLVAVSDAGTRFGLDGTFTTTCSAPALPGSVCVSAS